MSRGKRAVKRYVLKDEKYGSTVITSFINSMMRDGKKSVAKRNFYGALDIVMKKSNKDPLEAFEKILDNVRPLDLCHLQHKLICFYNRDEKCLQRGTY
jgi:small subunit ribosomal protein S7